MKRISNVQFIRNDCGLQGWICDNYNHPLFPWFVDRFEMEFHRYHSHLKVQVTIPGYGGSFRVAIFDYFAKDAIKLYYFLIMSKRSKNKEIKKTPKIVMDAPICQLSLEM